MSGYRIPRKHFLAAFGAVLVALFTGGKLSAQSKARPASAESGSNVNELAKKEPRAISRSV